MKLETDIQRIEQLAKQREEVNWAFRCFLKGSDLSTRSIDLEVHDLYREVSLEIDCTKCANPRTKGQVSTINKTLQTVQTRLLYQKTLLPDPKTPDDGK